MEKQGYLITREMVYGGKVPMIPEDHEDTGEFRPGQPNEIILSTIDGSARPVVSPAMYTEPRIILRKKRVRKVVLTQVGERCPKEGEFIELADGRMIRANFDAPVVCLCFTREEVFE